MLRGQPADALPPTESWRNLRRCLKTVRSSAASSALWLISCALSGGGSGTRRLHSKHISGTTLTQWQHGSVLFALSDAAPSLQCLLPRQHNLVKHVAVFHTNRHGPFVYSIAVSHLSIFKWCSYYYCTLHLPLPALT